ncbi:hypothetical protein AHF37_10302 [Paragonimus kellicotti]|nr:hypothetical protein AHF37_10302 [Paragonimus kellicotti]
MGSMIICSSPFPYLCVQHLVLRTPGVLHCLSTSVLRMRLLLLQ